MGKYCPHFPLIIIITFHFLWNKWKEGRWHTYAGVQLGSFSCYNFKLWWWMDGWWRNVYYIILFSVFLFYHIAPNVLLHHICLFYHISLFCLYHYIINYLVSVAINVNQNDASASSTDPFPASRDCICLRVVLPFRKQPQWAWVGGRLLPAARCA